MLRNRWNIIFMVGLVLLGIAVRCMSFLTFDTVWLTECANRLLHGGSYYHNFFETNPPLILLIYMPAIFLQSIFHMSMKLSIGVYSLLLIFSSLWLTNYVLVKTNIKASMRRHFIFAAVLLFWVIPGLAFAEREYFSLLFCLPYFALIVLQLHHKPPNLLIIIATGLLAGIGLALKPYFLCVMMLIELYFMLKKRSLLACFRVETAVITLFLFAYVYFVGWLTPEYYQTILPLTLLLYVGHFYYYSVLSLITRAPGLAVFMSMILLMPILLKSKSNDFINILFLAAIGFFIAFLWQGQVFSYHIFPSLALMTLIYFILAEQQAVAFFSNKISASNLFNIKLYGLVVVLVFLLMSLMHYFSMMVEAYVNPHSSYKETSKIINQNIHGQPVMFIDTWFNPFGLQQTTQMALNQRMPSMLLVPGIERLKLIGHEHEYRQIKQAFISYMLQDMIHERPPLILVARSGYTTWLDNRSYHQSYMAFFKSDQHFRRFFQSYHLYKKTTLYNIYEKS